ncbi:MAG TPA: DUF1707 domain-containing protein [Amycolatopsis sp.]|uniref:DUF1707 SHOCT-like domain-containing protein n=1 Tax=Amycolatopsis sp. TaxID=37632 RepID=UPI002B4A469D|nr:DUF1707 domain-containing protein [Amycolatopsis sp.]HKS47677.1 DUF1707 domain-containing protein [Amycolatopsis sp.]
MRLSDAERDEAINALSEHVRTGRLDIEEFGTRSAKVSTARTRGELLPLFTDLPAPRPSVLDEPAKPVALRRFVPGVVPIAVVVALLLYFTVARGMWLVFLLPAAVALVYAGRSR